MKSLSIFLTIIFASTSMQAQITVGEITLPNIGDVLKYGQFNYEDDTTTYRVNGDNIRWKYSNLIIDDFEEETYSDISGSPLQDSFPNANMVITGIGFESIAVRTANSIDIVGISGGPLALLGIGATSLSDPFEFKKVPINIGDKFSDEIEVSFTVSSDLIPGLDTIAVPIPGATLDSIRFTITLGKSEEATAWGTLELLGEEYEVLKIEQIDFTSNKIDIGLGIFGQTVWIDASAFLGNAFGGNNESRTYKFLTADSKESILEITENRLPLDTIGNTELTVTGRIKASLVTSIKDEYSEIADLTIYPNPASSWVMLQSDEIKGQKTTLIITNSLGQVIHVKENVVNSRIDISHLVAGEYMFDVRAEGARGVIKVVVW